MIEIIIKIIVLVFLFYLFCIIVFISKKCTFVEDYIEKAWWLILLRQYRLANKVLEEYLNSDGNHFINNGINIIENPLCAVGSTKASFEQQIDIYLMQITCYYHYRKCKIDYVLTCLRDYLKLNMEKVNNNHLNTIYRKLYKYKVVDEWSVF